MVLDLYMYLFYNGSKSRDGLRRFYGRGADPREFVRKYVSRTKTFRGKHLYGDFMNMYSDEIRARSWV